MLRRALISLAAAALVSSVAHSPLAGSAHALPCYSQVEYEIVAIPFVRTTSGVTTGDSWFHTYRTVVAGPTTFRLTAPGTLYFRVVDLDCRTVCLAVETDRWGRAECTGDVTGPVFMYVAIYGVPALTPFTLEAVSPTTSLPAECSDGVDNDLDGRTDYPADTGCASASGPSEGTPTPPGTCTPSYPACVKIVAGGVVQDVAAVAPHTYVAATHHVAGAIDLYKFPLPTGGYVTAPCVVLTVSASTHDTCGAAGGTYASRVALLVDRNVDQPGVGVTPGAMVARICTATYTVTVGGIGLHDFPAYTPC